MAANYVTHKFDGKLTKEELQKHFDSWQGSARVRYGHRYDNGAISEARGLTIDDMVCQGWKEADNYLHPKVHKRGPAVAIRLQEPGQPECWFIGAICAA